MTTWNYNLQPASSVSVTTAAPATASAPAVAAPRYNAEQVAMLQNLLRAPENHAVTAQLMRDADAAGLQNNQADSLRLLDMANNAFGNPVRAAAEQPGNDIMLATPTSQGMAQTIDQQQQLVESGRSTNMNAQDQAILRSRIENLVKDMGNASPEDKIRAARALTGSQEAAEFAEQTVREITAPEQFAVLNTQPAAATTVAASPAATANDSFFAALLLGANPKAEEARDNAQRLDEWRRPLSYPIGPIAQPEPSAPFSAVTTTVAAAIDNSNALLGHLESPLVPDVRNPNGAVRSV